MTNQVDNQELRDFIISTLGAIHDGIAQARVSRSRGIAGSDAFRMPGKVAFDVAVTANHTEQTGGGFKVQIAGIGANLGAEDTSSRQSVSRIQFDVPWAYESAFAATLPPASSRSSHNDEPEQND